MALTKRYVKKHAQARQRRRLKAQERLARDRRQAQHAAKVVEQALQDLGLPDNVVAEIEGRLRSQHLLRHHFLKLLAVTIAHGISYTDSLTNPYHKTKSHSNRIDE
jgi:intergrase/recombinase